MKHIKSIHVIGLICIADLIFASHGFFAIIVLVGYGIYRLEKCEDCPEQKPEEPISNYPTPRQPNDMVELPANPGAKERGNSNVLPDKKF